jgi:hypothetical protein
MKKDSRLKKKCPNPMLSSPKCERCGEPLKNDVYGDRCEDCWAMCNGNTSHLSKNYAQEVEEREKRRNPKHD